MSTLESRIVGLVCGALLGFCLVTLATDTQRPWEDGTAPLEDILPGNDTMGEFEMQDLRDLAAVTHPDKIYAVNFQPTSATSTIYAVSVAAGAQIEFITSTFKLYVHHRVWYADSNFTEGYTAYPAEGYVDLNTPIPPGAECRLEFRPDDTAS